MTKSGQNEKNSHPENNATNDSKTESPLSPTESGRHYNWKLNWIEPMIFQPGGAQNWIELKDFFFEPGWSGAPAIIGWIVDLPSVHHLFMEINEQDKIFGQFWNPLCEIERFLSQPKNGTQEILLPYIPFVLCQIVYAPKS